MKIQIVIAVLVRTFQGATPKETELSPADYVVNQPQAAVQRMKEFSNIFSQLTRVAAPISVASSLDDDRILQKITPILGERSHPLKRREVPGTSYSYSGRGGVGGGGDDKPGQETFNSDGSFSKNFQTENGISSQVSGYQKWLGAGEEGQVMMGRYSYTAPDGRTVITQWTADERGFLAKISASLPAGSGETPLRLADQER